MKLGLCNETCGTYVGCMQDKTTSRGDTLFYVPEWSTGGPRMTLLLPLFSDFLSLLLAHHGHRLRVGYPPTLASLGYHHWWVAPPPPRPPSEGASGCTGRRHGQQPVSGTAGPGVVKQDKSSRGSVDTTKTRSGPQRLRMSSGERPIGTAKGKQSDTEALCPDMY